MASISVSFPGTNMKLDLLSYKMFGNGFDPILDLITHFYFYFYTFLYIFKGFIVNLPSVK
jgi:hypothetical protein